MAGASFRIQLCTRSSLELLSGILLLKLFVLPKLNTNILSHKSIFPFRFRLGPDCIVQEIRLFTNYPREEEKFERGTYRELAWQNTNPRYDKDFRKKLMREKRKCDVKAIRDGHAVAGICDSC